MAWVSPSSLVPDSVYQMNGVTINKYLLKDHNVNNIDLPSKRTHKFKGVVIHNTDRVGAADEGKQYTAATLNGAVASRTNAYVTELGAWQNLEFDDMNWTCGDGTTGDGNNGCISLEIIMKSRNADIDIQSRDNGAKIAAYILYKNNMTVNDMYTHNYFLNIRDGVKGDYNYLCTTPTPTRNCPYYIVWDWEGFRKQVDGYIAKLGGRSIYNQDDQTPVTSVSNIYKSVSSAAIRTAPSKSAAILGRVTKGNFYPADAVTNSWFKHAAQNAYSMLNDEGMLFLKDGDWVIKTTTAYVNVRSTPSISGIKLGLLRPGIKIYAFNVATIKKDGYNWQKIIYDGKVGYAASEYMK